MASPISPWTTPQLLNLLRPRRLPDEVRYGMLEGIVKDHGFTIVSFLDERVYGGQVVPWGVVKLYEHPALPLRFRTTRLLHEAVHILRMTTLYPRLKRLGPWWWGLCYLLNPWYRRREEKLAEAHETALRGAQAGASNTATALAHHVSARLGGWFRSPYFAGGDEKQIRQQIAEMAVQLRRWAGGILLMDDPDQ